MSVKAGFAVGAEKMGHAHAVLAQNQLEMRVAALRTNFAHAAESQQVQWNIVVVELVDNDPRIQFTENKVTGFMMPAAVSGKIFR